METRANYVLIGAFTIGVALAALAFVFWFAGVGRFSDRLSYEVLFRGSVSGLSRGSVVLFNGVKVGEVQQILFLPNDPSQVAATAVLARGTPVRADTKARLELQGLTGAAAIALTGGKADAPELREKDGFSGVIVAEPSQLQNILENVQALTTKADAALTRINALVDGNGANVTAAIANIADITKQFDANGSGVSGALRSVADLSNSLGPTVQGLQKVVAHVDALVTSVDPSQVKDMAANADKFAKALGDNADGLDAILGQLGSIAKSLDPVIASAKDLVATLDKMSQGIDMKKIGGAIDSLERISAHVGELVSAVDGKQVKDAVADASKFAKALGDNSDAVGQLLGKFGAVAKDVEPIVAGAKDVVAALGVIAKAVDAKKVGGAIDNLQAFSATLNEAKPQLQSIASDVAALAKKLNAGSGDITASFADLDAALKAFDPQKVAAIADGLASFAGTLKANRDNVDGFLKDAAELAKKLNGSADKLDGLVSSVAGLAGGGGDGKNAVAEVGAAAASVRALADQINQQVRAIAPGLTRFSGQGLREVEGLASDGRRMVNDADRVVKGFERNPSQLIFGAKPGLPEYHGGP